VFPFVGNFFRRTALLFLENSSKAVTFCKIYLYVYVFIFQADIKPQADGCNGLRYNLTADIIESIFRTYPAGL